MSAQGRGPRLGGEHDFYETPGWAVDLILPHLHPMAFSGYIMDPSAGHGAILRRVSNYMEPAAAWDFLVACEIRPEAAEHLQDAARLVFTGDWTKVFEWEKRPPAPSLIIGNPPYKDAMVHLEHAIAYVRPGGQVAFLLRAAFMESAKRYDFHRRHPADVYIFSKRPSFRGKGTDATAYMWWVYTKGVNTDAGRIRVLPGPPAPAFPAPWEGESEE